uniref:ENR1 protein n=1 Tax=Crocodylus porosus TaxID=8502 RepID=A0A7M4FGQ1_CROPO
MLNRIIRLQAVLEIITNQTATALELLARQSSQMREAIYQNRMALDYLLAEEGGVCGKFNLSNCCLQIDDNGKAVLEIAKEIRKIAHVPIQTWKNTWDGDWWSNLFGGTWWRKVAFVFLCALAGLIFIPCLIPCFIRLITTTVEGMQVATIPLKAQTAAKVMVLRKIPRNYLSLSK